MTTITLEVSDELAARLSPMRDQLPALLSIALDLFPTESSPTTEKMPLNPSLKETMDFLVSRPTPAEIIAFKISPAAQGRLEELLDKNREDRLTEGEAIELDTYQQINHLLILLKAHARSVLTSSN